MHDPVIHGEGRQPGGDRPVRVGLVGAGPWASMFHGPLLSEGPETTLSGVWARRRDAAAQLAAQHGATAYDTYDDLLDACEAVAFAVPPDVQATLAVRAAEAGNAVLLDKPIALDVAAAGRLAGAIDAAGVGSLVVFTVRYADEVRRFVEAVRRLDNPVGAQLTMVTSAFLAGPFSASPWRHEHGALMDLGPHAVDLVAAALGPVRALSARHSGRGWVSMTMEHDGGAMSDLSLCGTANGGSPARITVWGEHDLVELTWAGTIDEQRLRSTLRSEFAHVARTGAPHECDVRRGLQIQRWLAGAVG